MRVGRGWRGVDWMGFAAVLGVASGAPAGAAVLRAYVGTYTPRPPVPGQPPPRRTPSSIDFAKGRGIYLVEVDSETGAMSEPRLAAETVAASWLVIEPRRGVLYAANEWSGGPGGSGTVSAFRIDRASGALTPLNIKPTGGSPVSLALHPSGDFLLAANYGGGSVGVLPVDADGALGDPTHVVRMMESGGPAPPPSPNARYDDGPAAVHMVGMDHGGRFVIANDAVNDRVFVWRLDEKTGRLAPNRPAWFDVTRGSFPRHFVLSPDDRQLYNVGERDSMLTMSEVAVQDGEIALSPRQSVSTLPADFRGSNQTSELLITDNGRFLYAANRNHNTIATFARGQGGQLTYVGETPTENDHPRTMALDPANRFLFSLNQRGDSITVFRLDPRSGMPRYTRLAVKIDSPASIAFIPDDMP